MGMVPRLCRLIAAAVVLSASTSAIAQVIPPSELPGRERERFQDLPTPRAQPGGPAIKLPSTVAPAGADKIVLLLRGVQIEGGTIYRPEDLAELYRDLIGHQVTLAAVYDIAQRITTKYGQDGYVLSRAVVPPQELSPGGAVIRIQIIEGYIDKVEWPASIASYFDYFSDYSAKIIADRPTNIRTLERYLLLAGDLPGLKFKNSLKPSATHPGAATLVVEVVEKPVDAFSRVDNRGTRARGPGQHYNTLTLNNLARIHEAFTVVYAGAFQSRELQYLGANWRHVLNSEGLTLFINSYASRSKPGTPELELLEYKTRSTLVEGGLAYPVIRQRERNLTVTALVFMSDDRSDILDTLNTLDRMRGARAKADADWADRWAGINQVNVVLSQGFRDFGATENGSIFASRANGRVDFTKIEATASRTQPLIDRLSLLVAAYGQYAATPLLSPELCGYGGRAFGRAFDPSEMVGDSCLQLLAELRLDVPSTITALTHQLYGFADRGWLHNIAPVLGTPVNVDGASVGGGIRLGLQALPAVFTADLSAAKGVDGPRNEWRFFAVVTGRY